MITVLILIIVAIATPNLLKANRSYRLRSAAQQIVQTFQVAKMQALRINQSYVIAFDQSSHSIIHNNQMVALPNGVQFEALTDNIAAPEAIQKATVNPPSLPSQQLDPKITISFPVQPLSNQCIIAFNAKGLPNVEPGVLNWVYLKNTDGERIVVLLTSAGGTMVLHYKSGEWV